MEPRKMIDPIVKVSGLTYYYQGQEQPVLRDVDLEVYPGEFLLLIGPSGCGKSTQITKVSAEI